MRKFLFALLSSAALAASAATSSTIVNYSEIDPTTSFEHSWTCEITTDPATAQPVATIQELTRIGGETTPYPNIDITIPSSISVENGTTTNGYIVKEIATGAFANQPGITGFTIPETVERIGDGAFANCPVLHRFVVEEDNPWFRVYGGALYNYDLTVLYAVPACSTVITLSPSLKEIKPRAFEGCHLLSSVTIPASVTTIGASAFKNASKLKSITFEGNAPTFGTTVFTGVASDATVYVSQSSTGWAFTIGSDWNSDGTTLHTAKSDAEIPSGVTSIEIEGVTWFYRVINSTAEIYNNGNCAVSPQNVVQTYTANPDDPENPVADGLVKIPEKFGDYAVTRIGDGAFKGCTSMIGLEIPAAVTKIGDYAFQNCSAASNIVLPDVVTTIGYHPFEGCAVTSIDLPAGLRSVNGNPFAGCETILNVTLDSNNSYFSVLNNILFDKDQKLLIGCPARSETAPIVSTVTTIGPEAFSGCFRLSSIRLPDGLTTVCSNAFADCVRLSSVAFPSKTSVLQGPALFANCSSLTNIGFTGNAPTVFDPDIFENAPADLEIKVGHDTTGWDGTAGSSVLPAKWPSDDSKGRKISRSDVSAETELVDGDVFVLITTNGQENISWTLKVLANRGTEILGISPKQRGSLTIPSEFTCSLGALTVKKLGDNLFANHTGLTSVTLSDTITEIGDSVFTNCDVLAEVKLNYGLRTIGRDAFYGTAIQTLEIPATVREITGNPICGCDPSISISVADGSPYFAVSSEGALYDADFTTLIAVPMTLEELNVPATVTTFAEKAFAGSIRMKKVTFAGNAPTAADGDDLYVDAHASLTNYVSSSNTSFGPLPGKWHDRPVVGDGAEPEEEGEFNYRIVSGSYAEIYNAGNAAIDATTYGSITIPETLGGYPVKKIGVGAFSNCVNITSISIPSTVTEIGDYAFYGCEMLESIELPTALTTIGKLPFFETSIESIDLPSKVKNLNGNPVAGCEYLNEITVDSKNRYFVAENGMLFNKKQTLLIACQTYAEEITIPQTITQIGDNALSCCFDLVTVNFEGNAPSCSDDLYIDCDEVISYVTEEATGFTADTWKGHAIVILGSSEILSDGTWYYTLDDEGYATLANNGKCALVNPSVTTSVTLPSSIDGHTVIALGDFAVAGVKGITTISVPDTYESIGDGAFSNCTSLASATIGKAVRSIGRWPFYNTAITTLTIPDSVNSIDGNPGAGASMLTEVTAADTQPYFSSDDGLLYDKSQETLLACPATKSDITLPETVTQIAEDAFYGCNLIANGNEVDGDVTWKYSTDGSTATITEADGATGVITIPATLGGYPVTSIETAALNGCTGITEFVSLSSAFTTKYGCLYSADGTILIRVPDQLILPYVQTTSSNVYDIVHSQIPGVTTVLDVAVPQYVHTYKTNSIVNKTVKLNRSGDVSYAELLKDVVIVRDFAFYGCNLFENSSTATTNVLSNVISHTTDSQIKVVTTTQYGTIATTYESELSLAESVLKVESKALTGSGITYDGELPNISVDDYPYEIELSALNAASAIALAEAEFFPLSSPYPDVVSDADYLGYFKLTATPVSGKSGYYTVTAQLDADAIAFSTSESQMFAKVSEIAAGTTDRTTLSTKPGLYYTIRASASASGDYKIVDSRLASGTSTELLMTRPSSESGFYRLEVSITNPQ